MELPREPGLRDARVLGERPRRGAGGRRRPPRPEHGGERVDERLRGCRLHGVPGGISGSAATRHVHLPSKDRERDHGRRERGRGVQRREPRPARSLPCNARRAAGAHPGPRRELRGRRCAAERCPRWPDRDHGRADSRRNRRAPPNAQRHRREPCRQPLQRRRRRGPSRQRPSAAQGSTTTAAAPR